VVVQGTRRSRCYVPLIPSDYPPRVISIGLPVQQSSRSAAKALVSRAMRRLNDDRFQEAEQDLLACHRLARLIGRSAFLISGIVGFEIERVAATGDRGLLRYPKLTSFDARAYRTELQNLPAFPRVADEMEFAERLSCLDALITVIRGMLQQDWTAEQIENRRRSFNEALFVVNQVYDMMSADGRQSPSVIYGEEFAEKLDVIRNTAQELVDEVNGKPMLKPLEQILAYYNGSSPEEIGRQMGWGFVALMLPACDKAYHSENRARTEDALTQVGFALVAYRADYDRFPRDLDCLAPEYMQAIPKDLFSDQPLRYSVNGKGFIVYSLGGNGNDDQERNSDSRPPGDDIALHYSLEL
jgi:hypothetical protein